MATPTHATVLKAFDALDLLGLDRPEITSDIVASELEMSHATAHRFLVTLEAAGILTTIRRGAYGPGPRLARLGRMAEDLAPVGPRVQDQLDRLRRELGESTMACRYTARGPICVAVSQAQRPITVNIRTGTTLPMLNTAQGRIWLAHMSAPQRQSWARGQGLEAAELDALEPEIARIREHGCARNLGDNEPDIAAISVPVAGPDGQLALTLSVFGMLSRFGPEFLTRAEAQLKAAAKTLAT